MLNRRTAAAALAFVLLPVAAEARWRHRRKPSAWPAVETDGKAAGDSDRTEMHEKIESFWLPLLDAIRDGKAPPAILDNTLARETLRNDLIAISKLLRVA